MCKSTPYHMSHRAHGLAEGDDLTSEPQTLEVTVLATLPSTQEATTPLSCFIIAQLYIGVVRRNKKIPN